MFDAGTILDIAVSLTVMYLMLSLVGTAVNELFASIIALRARTLSDALLKIIDDPKLRGDFYNSGVIAGVKDFLGRHPSYIASADFAHALVNSLDPSKPIPAIADIQQAVQAMPDSNIRDVLLAQLAAAGNDADKLRNGLAQWFDAAMDRVGGVYTRYMKYVALVVGLLIAVAFNADTLSLGARLWQDPILRAQLVKNAGAILDENKSGMAAGDQKAAPAPAAPAPGVESGQAVGDKLEALRNKVDDAAAKLQPLPIGWSNGIGGNPFVRILGWLITGFAISFGAPFWFDLLSTFMSVRSSGDKPARADGN